MCCARPGSTLSRSAPAAAASRGSRTAPSSRPAPTPPARIRDRCATHAAAIAETLDITKICIPVYPGLFSALGLLLADHRQEYVRPVARHLEDTDPKALFKLYDDMERQAEQELSGRAAKSGIEFARLV